MIKIEGLVKVGGVALRDVLIGDTFIRKSAEPRCVYVRLDGGSVLRLLEQGTCILADNHFHEDARFELVDLRIEVFRR